jgi:MoaA/NifB/PqqE/SkfB family radical SAM enzyme
MKEYGDDWGKIDRWDKQKLVIKAIDKATLPVFLGLLGGEPTMHPNYSDLIELCHKAVSKHPDGRLYVTTNGSTKSSFFEQHKFYKQMYFLFSFHPEYEAKYGTGFTTLLNNIKIMKKRGFKCKVNVMLHPEQRFWDKTHTFVDELEKIDGLEIHPHFLYGDGDVHVTTDYSEEFFNRFKRFESYPTYLTFEDKAGKKQMYNDYNVFQKDITGFKGWDCWNNNYEISYDGLVHRVCFGEKKNLLTDIYYFKKIGKICSVICPHEKCNCDGLLKIYKEK